MNQSTPTIYPGRSSCLKRLSVIITGRPCRYTDPHSSSGEGKPVARSGRIHGLPTIADLLDARNVVRRYHPRTPLYLSPALSNGAGCEIYIKYENHSPVRSFKSRGALYGLSRLLPEERAAGVVTASTGNHGQAVAYAGGVLGIRSTVVVPPGTSSIKCEAIRSFGGDLRFSGRDLAEAAQHAQQLAADERKVYIEDGNDGGVMAGAASLAWEVVEELREVAVVVVAVGVRRLT